MDSNTLDSINVLGESLDSIREIRTSLSRKLAEAISLIVKAESEGDENSGKLELSSSISELTNLCDSLEDGVFKFLVLGDMKRGKSTFLNALLGEDVLPRDVNPCTAVLTIIRYGECENKEVTVYYNDGKPPKSLAYDEFKEGFTISPDEAKKFAEENRDAFPDVDYAVINSPLPLLRRGVEVIDSPGLNDTEKRDELTLNFIKECHAILFVLSATQQWTRNEERYLETYILDRGLTVFFLINMWDDIARRLDDPEDLNEVQQAENRVRKVFRSNLDKYCEKNGESLYDRRVFEISALRALVAQRKGKSMEGTGVDYFLKGLRSFLLQSRVASELNIVLQTIRRLKRLTRERVNKRISLLRESVEETQAKVDLVQPKLDDMKRLGNELVDSLVQVRDGLAIEIGSSFHDYILELSDTFEVDFLKYQPDVNVIQTALSKSKQRELEATLGNAFERYLKGKIADWSRRTEYIIKSGFEELALKAQDFSKYYEKTVDSIAEVMSEGQLEVFPDEEEGLPLWQQFLGGSNSIDLDEISSINLGGGEVIDWEKISSKFVGMIVTSGLLFAISSVVIGPIIGIMAGVGLGANKADKIKKDILRMMKLELNKILPQIAMDGRLEIHQNIQVHLTNYLQGIHDNIHNDISARQGELMNLLEAKKRKEIDFEGERERLMTFSESVQVITESIEDECLKFNEGQIK